jgi:hypothetical protein
MFRQAQHDRKFRQAYLLTSKLNMTESCQPELVEGAPWNKFLKSNVQRTISITLRKK